MVSTVNQLPRDMSSCFTKAIPSRKSVRTTPTPTPPHQQRNTHLREQQLALVYEGVPVLLLEQVSRCQLSTREVLQPNYTLSPGVSRVWCWGIALQLDEPRLEGPGALACCLRWQNPVDVLGPGFTAKHHVQPLAWPHNEAGVLRACAHGIAQHSTAARVFKELAEHTHAANLHTLPSVHDTGA